MSENKFKWLLDSCYTRFGVRLEKGKTYPAKSFNPAVLAEWEKTGAISFEKTAKKEKGD